MFGPNQDQPLDAAVVHEKFAALTGDIRTATGDTRTPVEVAEGFLRIAVENMANAIKKISVQRGYDVTEYTLCSFGGAAGQPFAVVREALAGVCGGERMARNGAADRPCSLGARRGRPRTARRLARAPTRGTFGPAPPCHRG